MVYLRRRTTVLVAVIAAQGAIGYLQYFTGVPAWLVLLHIVGSVVFWVSVLFVRLAARDRGPADRATTAQSATATIDPRSTELGSGTRRT